MGNPTYTNTGVTVGNIATFNDRFGNIQDGGTSLAALIAQIEAAGVSQINAGTGISVNHTSGNVTVTNTGATSLTTTGTSGAATLSGGVLNIPQYAAGTGTVTSVAGVTANGFAPSVAQGTTAAQITMAVNNLVGILKGTGSAVTTATSGVDYQPATTAAAVTHNYVTAIGSNGSVTLAQPTTKDILGVTDGSNAAAGYIGEVMSTNGTVTLSTSGAYYTAASITLSAGDWDVSGQVVFAFTSGTTGNQFLGYIGTSTPVPNFYTAYVATMATPAVPQSGGIGTFRISTSTPVTYYMFGFSSFSGTAPSFYGSIFARRSR
jgi:hypothetical protein